MKKTLTTVFLLLSISSLISAQEKVKSTGFAYQQTEGFYFDSYNVRHIMVDRIYGKEIYPNVITGYNIQPGIKAAWVRNNNIDEDYGKALLTANISAFARGYIELLPQFKIGFQSEIVGMGGYGTIWHNNRFVNVSEGIYEYGIIAGFRPSIAFTYNDILVDINFGNIGLNRYTEETATGSLSSSSGLSGGLLNRNYVQLQVIKNINSKD